MPIYIALNTRLFRPSCMQLGRNSLVFRANMYIIREEIIRWSLFEAPLAYTLLLSGQLTIVTCFCVLHNNIIFELLNEHFFNYLNEKITMKMNIFYIKTLITGDRRISHWRNRRDLLQVRWIVTESHKIVCRIVSLTLTSIFLSRNTISW